MRGGNRDGKQPCYITAADGPGLVFAGLWDRWLPQGSESEPIESCAILVTAANAIIRPIHDRIPVILPPAAYKRWLSAGDLGGQPQGEAAAVRSADAQSLAGQHPGEQPRE